MSRRPAPLTLPIAVLSLLLAALLPRQHAAEASTVPASPWSGPAESATVETPPAPAFPAPVDAPRGQVEGQVEGQVRGQVRGPVTGPVFSEPGEGTVRQLLLRNLRHTPRGARIEVVTWAFASDGLARELVLASRRGVTVRVLVGGISCEEPSVRRLARTLAAGSAVRCSAYSARGESSFAGDEANLHQKSWTFSRVGPARHVTVVTTANATWAADGEQYNDAYQLVDRPDVHARMSAVFEQQWRGGARQDPFRTFRLGGGESLMFTPWNGPGMADPVLRRIRALPGPGTTIRVAQSNWSDERGVRIARALARKQRAGADVAALVSRPFSPVAREVLEQAGIAVHDAWFGPRRYHHLKFMTAAYDDGGARVTRVWTGSENWWSPSRGHDELVLQLGDAQAHDAYVGFFDQVVDDT